ncbi:MAG: hypothetical protein GQE15_05185 [Archangiaceae bacterium]|nr:hypothetical protein [Archangiaceae bacterium]
MNASAVIAAARALQGALGLFHGDLAVVVVGETVEVLHPVASLDAMKHGDQNRRAHELVGQPRDPEGLVAAGDRLRGQPSRGQLVASTVGAALARLEQHLASTQRGVLPFAAFVATLPAEATCLVVEGGPVDRTTIVIVDGGVSLLLDYAGDGP